MGRRQLESVHAHRAAHATAGAEQKDHYARVVDVSFLHASARLPAHVVYRTFGAETLALNLESGVYHGLNATAGRMLEVTTTSGTIGEAVDQLVDELDADRDTIASDVARLCVDLQERGLVEITNPS